MELVFDILIPIALLGVLVPLGMGLYAMARGGEYNRLNGNRFMRWRVTLQAVAVTLLAIAFWYKATH